MMYEKQSKVVEYTDTDGISGKMWIDSYFGVPMRKEFTVDGNPETEIFYGFSKGGVTEGMVTVPGDLEIR
jgi:hypothetical protein